MATSNYGNFFNKDGKKGVLMVIRQGHSNLYTAKVSRDEYKKYQTQGILKKLYKGSLKNFLSALYFEENINNDELKEIKDWFNKKEKDNL